LETESSGQDNNSRQHLFKAYPGMYQFRHLPGLAAFIRDQHIAAFAKLQYDRSVAMHLPLLEHFSSYSTEELALIGQRSAHELLDAVASNGISEFIIASVRRWVSNELSLPHYFDVVVEDITVLNFVRAEAFRKFIPGYTTDLETALELTSEIDRLFMGYTTSSMVTFIDLLRARISRQETQLLEAESIAHLGSFDWDIINDVNVSSPELRKILGTETPMPLADFLDQVHPDDSDLLREAIASAFVTGNLHCEFRYQTPQQQKTLWGRGVVHIGANGPERMIGVIQDVTDRKRMEETLLLKTLELERSNEELQQFASVASHDLKEPLRKIVLYTGLLEGADIANWPEDALRNLTRIKDAARRMRLLIEDILAFSSINQQQEPQAISLERLLDEVREVLESRIRETGATIDSDGLPEALVIPFQFRQLFQNLLSNSLKFTSPGVPPVIHIRHKIADAQSLPALPQAPSGSLLELTFTDNGIGFPQKYAEKIFGLFSRLHSRNQYEGTGLGLAICRKVAENHGGRIEADSEPGKGTTFRIVIPQ
jgi:signal transduction histidine kinase